MFGLQDSETHIILNSSVTFGPKWGILVSLSSYYNAEYWGIVIQHLDCTVQPTLYGCHWICYVRHITHTKILNCFVSLGLKSVKLVSLSSECNAHCWRIVIKQLACTCQPPLYGCHWIFYVRLTRQWDTYYSQQLSHFWSNVGPISVSVFVIQWGMLRNSHRTSSLYWSSCHVWLSLNLQLLAYMSAPNSLQLSHYMSKVGTISAVVITVQC
jgi:hypothetical protein